MWPEPTTAARAPTAWPPLWASAWGDDRYGLWAELHVGEALQRMSWIEPGRFWMGSDPEFDKGSQEDERPRHPVTLTQGFWLADTPCTQAFWLALLGGENPSRFKDQSDAPRRPVEQVSWDDVQGFLATLNAKLPAGEQAALPTEAQWEYAARAGTETAYWWGDAPDNARANWHMQHNGTTPVGSYEPNPWGLFDIHGNVWEWCEGGHRSYSRWAEVNPQDEGPTGSHRAVRGGSWYSSPGSARAAYRLERPRVDRLQILGFRLALRSSSQGR